MQFNDILIRCQVWSTVQHIKILWDFIRWLDYYHWSKILGWNLWVWSYPSPKDLYSFRHAQCFLSYHLTWLPWHGPLLPTKLNLVSLYRKKFFERVEQIFSLPLLINGKLWLIYRLKIHISNTYTIANLKWF